MSVEATQPTRHNFGVYSASSKGEGHPVMYGKPQPTKHFEAFPDGGGYPKGFIEWALSTLGNVDYSRVLHLCSGSVRTGFTVDLRESVRPRVVADARQTPFRDGSFEAIMCDPPYSLEYAQNLYGTTYPKPGELLREAARLLVEGGRVGLLHHLVPMNRAPMKFVKVYGVTTGLGTAIRAWSVLEKRSDARFRNGR
jgi:hypothetical protein